MHKNYQKWYQNFFDKRHKNALGTKKKEYKIAQYKIGTKKASSQKKQNQRRIRPGEMTSFLTIAQWKKIKVLYYCVNYKKKDSYKKKNLIYVKSTLLDIDIYWLSCTPKGFLEVKK